MDNQHQKIVGYRDLSQSEIDLINELKRAEEHAAEMVQQLTALAEEEGHDGAKRWAAIARTHLETGFMFAIKAVARPTNGLGRSVR